MIQYRGICKPIDTRLQMISATPPSFIHTLPLLQSDPVFLQLDTKNETVTQKTQLHYVYNKTTKCLEMKYAVNDFSENSTIHPDKKSPENNVEITIQIKKIKSPN